MGQRRFLMEDRDGKGSTTGWVVWAQNHLLQKRQFASDGVRFFYQPTTRSAFIIVNPRDIPDNAMKALQAAMKK